PGPRGGQAPEQASPGQARPRPARGHHPPIRRTQPPSRRRPSFPPDRLRQLVHADEDAEEQPADEKPGRGAAPAIEGEACATQQQNRADQRIAGTRRGSRLLGAPLKLPVRSPQAAWIAVVVGHPERTIITNAAEAV